ncbi:MAG: class I tRNA ligase family protein, partial [Candidatus Liptonbacteria bacterium]|nr:class I tRNA ligase family protein [Candidatus Liptonbacteria bacterium]
VIGAEHTVLHLLYSRFITKFLQDEGYLNFGEPFLKLRHQGLILGEDGQKMSKSKGNVVNPDELIGEFGADTVRVYEMFMGPFEDGAPWDPKGMLGAERFLKRFWNYASSFVPAKAGTHVDRGSLIKSGTKEAESLLHKTIKKVGEDIENFKFNTAISSLMILLNELEKQPLSSVMGHESFVKILHPFAPHMAQELWELMGNKTILDFEPWPEYDPKLIEEEKFTLVIQVNGKVRDTIEVESDITEERAKEIALASEKVKSFVGNSSPKKIIYIPKKLVNIVV